MRDMPALSNLTERLVDLGASGGSLGQLIKATEDLGPILISPKLASELTSLHHRTLKRRQAEGRFPKSIPLSDGRIAYVLSDVFAWNAARVREALGQQRDHTNAADGEV